MSVSYALIVSDNIRPPSGPAIRSSAAGGEVLGRLGRVIRVLRLRAGYSQERFGDAIGMHRTYVGLLERGTGNPTMETLQTVALGLGVSLLDLLTLAMTEDSVEARAADRRVAGNRAVEPPGRTLRKGWHA